MKYYHVSKNKLPSVLEPIGYYESVRSGMLNYWYPLVDEPPIFPSSDVKESCFAKTPVGALFGLFSEGGNAGTYYVYSTNQRPHVNLIDEIVQDFGVIEEVRYREPVRIQLEGKLYIPKSVINQINNCYVGGFFNQDAGFDLKKQLNRWIVDRIKG